jgi:hypothetical protein
MQDVKKPNSTTTDNQSAVNFLINQWLYLDTEFEMGLMVKNSYSQILRELQAQSKEMFEKQIINAYYVNCDVNTIQTGEQYYNETFKSE